MPSPFPGMDPYLELSGVWPDFHASLLIYCRAALNSQLPDRYVAQVEERFILREVPDEPDRLIRPDVAVLHDPYAPAGPGATTAVLTLLEPVAVPLPPLLDLERETWIEIRDLPDGELVTVIEILSPSNKAEPDRRDYLVKRDGLFRRSINVVELDLLLGGHRLPMGAPLPPGHYYAFVSRPARWPDCDVFAWWLRQPLPTLPVPLKEPDPDVRLDLAAVMRTAYAEARYERRVRYRAPLTLPLHPDDHAWAEGLATAPR